MKKFYTLLLFAMLGVCANAQASWDGTSAIWTSGEGTSDNPFLIENGQHLAYLSEQVRNGETYEGKYFKLANDLDMGADSDKKFTPIGFYDEYTDPEQPESGLIDHSNYFLGVFDGNFRKIDNIHVYYIDDASVGGTGLFACISEGSIIKNMGIGNQSSIEGGDLTGGIVGCMKGGLIENCHSDALVEGGGMCIGGLVGAGEKGQVLNSYNAGMVKGATAVGGVVGSADKNITINNCYNQGMVNASGFYIGGIVGTLYAGTVTNCYNIGAVPDAEGLFVQAVIGATDKDPFVIENCYYEREMSTVSDDNAGVSEKTADEMKADAFIATLNGEQNPAPWEADAKNLNDGFPVLNWQNTGSVGIHKVQPELNCEIYSINQSVYVEFVSSSKLGQVVISDLAGRVIADEMLASGESINMENRGIYIVVLKVDSQCHVSKIVVK